MNIYVSNLSFNIQDEDLRDYFSEFGVVSSVKVITDKLTNRSRGFAFVEMPNDAEALAAMQALDGGVADGRAIKVTEAKPREEKSRRFQMS
jgi:RNA recognition motif-containing protein